MDAELKQYLEEMEGRQRADLERVETNLLREFRKWASTSDIRTRQSMETTSALNARMLNVEDRISALERSRLPPRADAA
jgi:hypothetical protein